MAIAVNPNRTIRYVLKRERELPKEQQTTWILKPLTLCEKFAVVSRAESHDGARGLWFSFEQLCQCLVGWENLLDEDGKPIAFEKGSDAGASAACIDRIAPDDASELIGELNRLNLPTRDEAGKS